MKLWRNKGLLLAGAALLVVAIPALGQQQQQQTPESLLPPGFGDPPPPSPTPAPAPPRPAAPSVPPTQSLPSIPLTDDPLAELDALPDEDLPAPPPPIELPDEARRSTRIVGTLGPANRGFGTDAFGVANGRFLSTLMRRLDAPLPSRWTSILLRRALLSRTPAPSRVAPVDWVAERAWLLLRMGEADAARMLVQAVDVDQFTPKMYEVAVQAALATADPAGLCPLVAGGRELSDEPVWPLSEAMCAALDGEASRASSLIDQARRRSGARGIDLLLAEKVVGAGTDTRRAVTIQWDSVDAVNAWRFGLASATGLEIPERLMNGAGPHVHAWMARAPMLPLERRLAASDVAASLGVFSSTSLVEIYSLIADSTDPSEISESVGGRLRQAYVARSIDRRMAAMRGIWSEATTPSGRHARRLLTASAAARIQPSENHSEDAANLIASMLSAGLDRHAARWAGMVAAMSGGEADRPWALLAVGGPGERVVASAARFEEFAGRDDSAGQQRSKLLLAALAGLGRISEAEQASLAEDLGVNLSVRNRWTRMLERAAQTGQPGTVALLAAIGMQTGDWRGVPAGHMFHIIRALREVGLDYEARMIAAEALSRL